MEKIEHQLTSSQARKIAEAAWGRGGTSSQKTNRKGAFYFSCSSHGGFVIDTRVLSEKEKHELLKYISTETMHQKLQVWFNNGKEVAMMHPYSVRSKRIPIGSQSIHFGVLLLEEDCDWALAYVCTEIRLIEEAEKAAKTLLHAQKTWENWLNPENPGVKHRKFEREQREAKSPDLIVSALSRDDKVEVYTADSKRYLVSGYDKARDEFGTPWLSKCATVEAM